MFSSGIRKSIALGLAAWLAFPMAGVHLFHNHSTSIYPRGIDPAVAAVSGSPLSLVGHRFGIRPENEVLNTAVMPQESDFCPVCLFLQNYHSQTLDRGIPEMCFRRPESRLGAQDEHQPANRVPGNPYPRPPPALPA